MKKKITAIIMAAVMLLSIIPLSAAALTNADYEYLIDTDGVHIVKYIGTQTEVEIPSTIDEKPVVSIQDGAFKGSNIVAVLIPASVKTLGKGVFENCTSLEEALIYDDSKLETIPENTYAGCSALSSVYLPNGIKKIDKAAFKGCSSLTSIIISGYATSIEAQAFADCTLLKSITIFNYVEKIDDTAFTNCPAVTIYGYHYTYAEAFAQENSIPFADIDIFYTLAEETEDTGTLQSHTLEMTVRKVIDVLYATYFFVDNITVTDAAGNTVTALNSACEAGMKFTIVNEFEETVYYVIQTPLMGDVDCSGEVKISDARYVLMYCVDMVYFTDEASFLADMNNNGEIEISDARAILKQIVS